MIDLAFAPSRVESALVEEIRRSPHYVADLALVGVTDDDQVIGFSMTSALELHTDDGRRVEVLGLAPVAVHPSHQRSGTGSALVDDGLRRAGAAGAPLVVVLGHPSYYPRFGFERASVYGIRPAAAWSDESFMVRVLSSDEPTLRGTVVYPAAFGG